MTRGRLRLILFIVGLIATWISLALGLFVSGPLLRSVWGVPTGFGEDYTTWQAVGQAMIAQGTLLVTAFIVCGRLLQPLVPDRAGLRTALMIANPLNVFAGYWLYYQLFYVGDNLHVELLYFRMSGAVLWSLMSVVLLAPAALLGLRLRRHSHLRAA